MHSILFYISFLILPLIFLGEPKKYRMLYEYPFDAIHYIEYNTVLHIGDIAKRKI